MSDGVRPQLLVVDDNHALAENLTELFEPRGFDVHFSPSARDAVTLAKTHGFDLALIDWNLPDAVGAELLPRLRAVSPFGEVVVITGHATVDAAVAAVRGGAFHYVVKPFKVDDLIATVESALRQSALRRERHALAQRLETSERRYREVVESAQVLFVGVDAGGLVRLFNRRASEVTGYAPEQVWGKRFFDEVLPPEAQDTVTRQLRTALNGNASDEFEVPLVTREGKLRTVRWHVVPAGSGDDTGDGNDEALALYAVGTDVTERRALERRTAEAEALAHMGTLAAGLAHEVRNPLNAALLQLHLLGRFVSRAGGTEQEAMSQKVRIVEGELKRLERLLSDFLELARPRPMARERLDLAALVEDVASFQEPAAMARGVSLVRRVSEGHAVGDRERLKQVFFNLVANALEASPPGAVITLGCHADPDDDGMVTVSVSDTGRGIPGAMLEKIFEPFFTTKEAGTGLGLSIVRQIVERHAGRVELESAEGRGTRVTVFIPSAR